MNQPRKNKIKTLVRFTQRLAAGGVWYRLAAAIFVGLYLAVFAWPLIKPSRATNGGQYPRLVNIYLRWELTDAAIKELAKWDVVIMDMEIQATTPELIRRLRGLNPNIKLLVYITSQEIRQDALTFKSAMRRRLATGIPDEWYLTKPSGERLSYWSGTNLLNVTNQSPLVNGERWNQYLAQFVSRELLGSGLWDGVFYDNAWDGISWFVGHNVDVNRDGIPDQDPDSAWQEGMRWLYSETRRLTNNKYLLVGNGGTKAYRNDLNGLMLESFPNYGGWRGTMDIYQAYEDGKPTPRVLLINRNTLNKGSQSDYRSMRFGLASTLMGSGYYSFDYGDQDHSQTWWYDEYGVKLGAPQGKPTALSGAAQFQEGIWRRDFDQGIALVNSTPNQETVDLGGEYEKIIGTQDASVNDGTIVDKIKLNPIDGLILLKTFQRLDGALFSNGAFARFYKSDGSRARNGFFAFEDGQPGGSLVYRGDLDGDGEMEKISAIGPKLEIFNSRGDRWFNDYPLGANFKGELRVAIGKLAPGATVQIAVTGSTGGRVVLYNYHGGIIKDDWYPLGRRYQSGFAVAIGNVDGGEGGEIVLEAKAVGRGASTLLVVDSTLSRIKYRLSLTTPTRAGLSVAVGDFLGTRQDQIAVVGLERNTPFLRFMNQRGKTLGGFYLTGLLKSQAISLGAVDVNFDGKKEVVVMSSN